MALGTSDHLITRYLNTGISSRPREVVPTDWGPEKCQTEATCLYFRGSVFLWLMRQERSFDTANSFPLVDPGVICGSTDEKL